MTYLCKCGYEWTPRKKNPKSCPKCKQYGKAKEKAHQ